MSIKNIVKISLIATLYATVSLVLAPFSFLGVQVRVAEALVVLVLFKREYIWALTLGCFLTNFLGVLGGVNVLGITDIIVGTSATLFATILMYKTRKIFFKGFPFLSFFFPIFINALFVGLELSILLHETFILKIFIIYFTQVFIGQFIACGLIGFNLYLFLKRNFLKTSA